MGNLRDGISKYYTTIFFLNVFLGIHKFSSCSREILFQLSSHFDQPFIKMGTFNWVRNKESWGKSQVFSKHCNSPFTKSMTSPLYLGYRVYMAKKIWFTALSDTSCSSFIIPIKAMDCWFSVFLSHQRLLHFVKVAFAVYVELYALLRTFWTLIKWSPVAINRITGVWRRNINFTDM